MNKQPGLMARVVAALGLAAVLLFAVTPAQAALSEAPAWSLQTPEGKTVNFPADAQHRPTVLMFWPSWCPFSRALQPYVQDIWKDYRDAGVNLWTINIKEDKDPVQVLRERGLSFPLLIQGDDVANAYGLQYTPWLVVIDQDNRIVYTRPPNPPSPVDTAKEVRAKLNTLLGDRAVPLPLSYPKPYDLHLKDPATRNQHLAPAPMDAGVWGPWVTQYLAAIPSDEAVKDMAPHGAIADGKTAIVAAREIWAKQYGEDAANAQAPYRSYRRNNRWVVLGEGLSSKLGTGFVLVIEADTGRVIRVARSAR